MKLGDLVKQVNAQTGRAVQSPGVNSPMTMLEAREKAGERGMRHACYGLVALSSAFIMLRWRPKVLPDLSELLEA